jgi:nucleotide-binding universal stress UspA family protein
VAATAETEQHNYDLLVTGYAPSNGPALVERLLEANLSTLLLVPQPQPVPSSALVSITDSEHGKEDVLLAAPLLQALGAETTLLCVVPEAGRNLAAHARADTFLADGARTLAALGISAQTVVRSGPVAEAIQQQMTAGQHDLLVLGAPLAGRSGRLAMSSVMRQTLEAASKHPVLIVRSRLAAGVGPQRTFDGRIIIVEEITP